MVLMVLLSTNNINHYHKLELKNYMGFKIYIQREHLGKYAIEITFNC